MKLEIWTEYGPLNSEPIFTAFIKSVKDAGDEVVLNKHSDADVAVIWSVLWLGRMRNYKRIWQRYKQANKPIVVIEVGGLRRNKSFKIAINGVNRKADFANQEVDDKRWPLFKHTLRPWQQRGQTIIILGQHNASEQWAGMPEMKTWLESQVQQIRKLTDRPIQIRPHPRNNIGFDVKKYQNVTLKHPVIDVSTIDDTDFKDTLKDAWAVVNHSSNPAIEAVINGIPVFVSEKSLCHDVGNTDLSDIMHPAMPARQNWANRLAYTEWFTEEFREGKPWARIRKRLEEKYLKK